jgi:hypothetical protein
MQSAKWELYLTQMGSSRRYIVAFFDALYVLVQMANVIEYGDGADTIHLEGYEQCTLESAPKALWAFFKAKVEKSPFSFRENVHLNIRVKDRPVQAYCFIVKGNTDMKFEEFRAFFDGIVSRI